jgi:F-type H+-transporting ATPase subunit c
MELLSSLIALVDATGMSYIAIGLATISMMSVGIGESMVAIKALDGMTRNPEMFSKLRSTMIIGCGIIESVAIYNLLIAIFIIFLG